MTKIVSLTNVAKDASGGAQVTSGDAHDSGDGAPDRLIESVAGGVITIGNFDGVHLGHQALLGEVRRLASDMGGPAVAVVLDPHPARLLRPDKAPMRLTWIERRAELMNRLGIDGLVVCETTHEFLRMTASEFFEALVIRRLKARSMVEGPNFFFGRDRGGDVDTLKQLCGNNQIDLQIAEPTEFDGQMISSTRIRERLAAGDVDGAARLLGTPHRIRGQVTEGAGRGRQIGFPTANLSGIDVVVPAHGVYGGVATIDGRSHHAAIHVGPNPTFENDGETKVEVHVLDYDHDLYGVSILVDFVTHVRDIARFDSAEQLIQQLDQDITTIRARLANHSVS